MNDIPIRTPDYISPFSCNCYYFDEMVRVLPDRRIERIRERNGTITATWEEFSCEIQAAYKKWRLDTAERILLGGRRES